MFMRIKLTTENITGLSKEVLSLLAEYDIDVKRIEVETGLMYLATEDLEKNIERDIASKLMQIKGVKWVENINLMPVNERNLFLNEILNAVSDPVLGINNKGRIIYQNTQAKISFSADKEVVTIKNIFNDPDWVNKVDSAATNVLPINIKTTAGSMLVEVRGIKQSGQKSIGAVLIFHKPENITARSHIIQGAEIKGFNGLIAYNKSMQEIINRARHISQTDVPLMLYGESGVGKKTIAQGTHVSSSRKNKLFSSINCTTSKQSQITRDLFGTASPTIGKAGLLEITDGGTLYIQGIQDMPNECQQKLFDFIQKGEFKRVGGKIKRHSKIKIIASSPLPLQNYVDNNQFSSDLFYTLDITHLQIPSLRDRQEDIEPLTTYFLTVFQSQGGKEVNEVSFAALNKIKSYYWPGNISQLKDILYKASLLTDSHTIDVDHIEIDGHVQIESNLDNRSLPQAVAEFEKHFLHHWYQKYSSTRKLAQKLGVSHTTIAQKLNKYDIN